MGTADAADDAVGLLLLMLLRTSVPKSDKKDNAFLRSAHPFIFI